MFEYLILNGNFQSAKTIDQVSSLSFRDYLLHHFNKGNREQFFQIFNFLRKQSKLEFYLRVYFFIYNIHPAISMGNSNKKSKGNIPEPEVIAFRDFLDNRGAQLAKTNQFLEFYALPFIKKPLQHEAFRNLFRKQWVNTLQQKLSLFINQEEKRLKTVVSKTLPAFTNQKDSSNISNSEERVLKQKVREMEKINKQLFEEVSQFAEKCNILQDNHKMMAEGFHSHMMQAQSKWFQITKQLVTCSKSLIQMLIASDSQFLGDRKFLKIKKRTEKYERFVNKKFDDLVSQSQDISIFDRPSLNQLSYSVTPYTQKSNGALIKDLSTIIGVDEYIPTDFQSLKNYLKKCTVADKISILNGFSWRIARSKDRNVRRLNISGIFKEDLLGIQTGQISQLLTSHQSMRSTVRLLQLISQDSFGRKLLFMNHNIYQDLVSLLQYCNDRNSFEAIVSMLSVISSERRFKLELIKLDIIEICISLLRKNKYEHNQMILENITTIMLNTIMLEEGLVKFEKEKDVFDVLRKYLQSPYKIVKTLIYGIIYSLLENEGLFRKAHSEKLPQFFDNIHKTDPTISKKQAYYIKDKVGKFQPKQTYGDGDNQNSDEQIDDDDSDTDQFPVSDIQNMFRHHEELSQKFSLKGKQAKNQFKEVKDFLQEVKSRQFVPKFYEPVKQLKSSDYHSPKHGNFINQQPETPYIRDPVKQNKKQEKYKKIDNFVSPPSQKEKQQLRKNKDFRIKEKDANKMNQSKEPKDTKIRRQIYQKRDDMNSQRIRKSVSADKSLNKIREQDQQRIYQSHRMQRQNKITQFKNSQQRMYRSPQCKKIPREQKLKQLNQQLQAGQLRRKSAYQSEQNRENKTHMKADKGQIKQAGEVFQSKPKLRRTPPNEQFN